MDDQHSVDGADEFRHEPGGEPYWGESIYLDVVDASGDLGGYVRLGLYPNLGQAWWTAAFTREGHGPVVAQLYDLPVEGGTGFSFARGEDRMVSEVAETLGSVRVEASTSAKAYDHPHEAYDDTAGRDVRLSLDLTWRSVGVPYHYAITSRYEIPCTVEGTISVDGEVFHLAGPGQRDHSWGVRDWWVHGWCWAALHFDDGQEVHFADIRIDGAPPLGYVQRDGVVDPIATLVVTETFDAEGLAGVTHAALSAHGIEVEITPTGYGPLLLTATDGRLSRFPRSMVRCRRGDGVQGLGWIEWNQPQG